MYAILKYQNSRENNFLSILHVIDNYEVADKLAYSYAEELYNSNISYSVKHSFVDIDCIRVQYTSGTGHNKIVFVVVSLPDVEYYDTENRQSKQ
jgi:hypothetical protein